MRKQMLSLVVGILILSLVACSSSNNSNIKTDTTSVAPPSESNQESVLTENVFLDAEMNHHVSDDGGTSVTILVEKEDALNASAEDYATFLEKRLEVAAVSNDLFSIIFGDGTGVTFYGCDPSNAVYGTISATGDPIEPSGYIMSNDDGTYVYKAYDDESVLNANSELKALLENMYQIGNGSSTSVSVEDHKASVWLMADVSFNTPDLKQEFEESFMSLHNTAKELITTLSEMEPIFEDYVLSTTLCTLDSTPLYCIEDGEILFDLIVT